MTVPTPNTQDQQIMLTNFSNQLQKEMGFSTTKFLKTTEEDDEWMNELYINIYQQMVMNRIGNRCQNIICQSKFPK